MVSPHQIFNSIQLFFIRFLIDPCEPGNSQILHAGGDRSTSCQNKDLTLCDDFMNNIWYRVQKNGRDLKMPTTCVAQHSCGTVYPIWLSGMYTQNDTFAFIRFE